MNSAENVDQYIRSFPREIQEIMLHIRKTILRAAPEAEECMAYQMPAYKLNGPLVYFAAGKKHIGFYPTPSGIEAFRHEFGNYKWSKGAVQFPLDQPMPLELIERMVKFRKEENMGKKK
jgi:uncharacterized protein YdhG (YjbR/CyaY superfamily)